MVVDLSQTIPNNLRCNKRALIKKNRRVLVFFRIEFRSFLLSVGHVCLLRVYLSIYARVLTEHHNETDLV